MDEKVKIPAGGKFIRKATKAEKLGGQARRAGHAKRIPAIPEGCTVVYKSYGLYGPGYYFVERR